MTKAFFIVKFEAGHTNIGEIPAGATVEQVAAGSGVTDASCYAQFSDADFPPDCFTFGHAFTLESGVVGFDLAKAQETAAIQVRAESVPRQHALLEGFTAEALAAQVALPATSRDARVQSVITALNAETQAVLDQEAAIYSAGSVAELSAIVSQV